MGEPAQFAIFIHQTNPLIHSITLTSPGHHTYSRRSDSLLLEKMVKVQAFINEVNLISIKILFSLYPENK